MPPRRSLVSVAATAALLIGADAPAAAAVLAPSARISGDVRERSGPQLDAFSVNSDDTGLQDLSGAADDPGGSAGSQADVSFRVAPVPGGEQLTAGGSASARSGLPVRESQGTSNVTTEFTVIEPASYSVSGTLTRSNPAGHCCGGGSAVLRDEDGEKLFSVVLDSGSSQGVASSGTLAPGEYTLTLEASVGYGFGAAASDVSGSAAFDVAFRLTLPGADTDGDALPDEWETEGVDVDGNGTIDLDLPGMGADPRHKDVFVELDFMPPHRLALAASAMLADAFADAPVANPDGTPGIALHLDNGADSVMNPRTGATWGSRSRQNSLVHQNVLGTVAGDEYDWSAFDALRATSFEAARRTVFRYAISAHGHDGRVSGVARAIPSSDLLVTLGAGCAHLNGGADCTLDAGAQAGTLMHELGHTLGLRHGGGDDLLNKPNHLSVMNYSFQLTGLQDATGNRFLDYSRFTISLDERALSEVQGFGITAEPPGDLVTVGSCPGGTRVAWPIKAGPVDFSCDGAFSSVSADVNGDGSKTALEPFTDWPALVFGGGSVGGSGTTPPDRTPRSEPSLDELVAAKTALDAALPTPQQPDAGASRTGPGDNGPGGGSTTIPPPVLTALRVRRGRVTYTLSAPARVRFTLERLLPGHRRGGRCRADGRGPRCTRGVRLRGRFSHAGRAGANRLRLPRRLGGRRLKPGRYRLVAVPAGGTARRAPFRLR
jgi:hypothetical protein